MIGGSSTTREIEHLPALASPSALDQRRGAPSRRRSVAAGWGVWRWDGSELVRGGRRVRRARACNRQEGRERVEVGAGGVQIAHPGRGPSSVSTADGRRVAERGGRRERCLTMQPVSFGESPARARRDSLARKPWRVETRALREAARRPEHDARPRVCSPGHAAAGMTRNRCQRALGHVANVSAERSFSAAVKDRGYAGFRG